MRGFFLVASAVLFVGAATVQVHSEEYSKTSKILPDEESDARSSADEILAKTENFPDGNMTTPMCLNTTEEGVPVIINATSTNSSISLEWENPPSLDGSVQSYAVSCSETKTGYYALNYTTDKQFTFPKLQPFMNYTVTVFAYILRICSNLTLKGLPNILTIQTEVAAPGAMKVFVSAVKDKQVELAWKVPNPQNGKVDGYQITYRNEETIDPNKVVKVDGSRTKKIIKDLTPRTYYTFKTKVFNVDKNNNSLFGPETFVSVTTKGTSEPQNLELIANSSTEIVVTWENPEDAFESLYGFIIRWWWNETTTPKFTYFNITEGESKESYTEVISDLRPWTKYNVSVSAIDLCDGNATEGPSTSQIERTLPSQPSSPKSLTVTVKSSSMIEVNWKGPESTNGPLNGFIIRWWSAESCNNFTYHVAEPTEGYSYTITNLTAWTEYNVSVSAFNRVNERILEGPPVSETETTQVEKPSTPKSLALTAKSSTLVEVNWEGPENKNGPLNGFIIQWRTAGYSNNFTYNITEQEEEYFYTITNLSPWTVYNVSVSAFIRENGKISEGPSVSKTGKTLPSGPSLPKSITLNVKSSSQIDVNWKNPDLKNGPLNGFILRWRSYKSSVKFIYNITELFEDYTYEMTNLIASTEYNVSVSAFNFLNGTFLEGPSVSKTERTLSSSKFSLNLLIKLSWLVNF